MLHCTISGDGRAMPRRNPALQHPRRVGCGSPCARSSATPLRPAMTAPLPALLDYPFAAPPAPGEAIEVAPGVCGCACRCRSRSITSTSGCFRSRTAGRWSTAATARRHARAVGTAFRDDARRREPIRRIIATHCHPDHVGNAAWLAARFGCAGGDDPRRVHGGARDRRTSTAATRCAATVELFRRHGMAGGASAPRCAAAATSTRAACRNCRRRSTGCSTATAIAVGGATDWRVIEGHGHSPEHASLYAARARHR